LEGAPFPAAVEVIIPNLVRANRRPSGQRGFLMHWRVGAYVLIADAFRLSNFST
jgi:predicted phage gp36 major capsid-like protein